MTSVRTVEVDLVDDWLATLDDKSYELVAAALEVLAEQGPSLGRPLADSIVGSTYRNMKELRTGSSGRSEVRILFAFDPARKAILLVAGDKAGNWQKWYRTNIPLADERYRQHLDRLKGERNAQDS